MATKTKVKLLIGRTGVGVAGDVVEYDDETAQAHAERGLCVVVTPDKPTKPAGKKDAKDAKDDDE